MTHKGHEVLEYWDCKNVASMYDKHLLGLEIDLVSAQIRPNSKILDAGCGEGEGTAVYARIPGVNIHAVDFSDTRLAKAAERLRECKNVLLKKVDFLSTYQLDRDYDYVISQRFLINLMEWDLQKKVLSDLKSLLRPGGRFVMLEGSAEGVATLNNVRNAFGLEPIPVKWHNLFFIDSVLTKFMASEGFRLIQEDGLGEYFFLTRGIRPYFDKELNWDSAFNALAASSGTRSVLQLKDKFSRLKLWVFEKGS